MNIEISDCKEIQNVTVHVDGNEEHCYVLDFEYEGKVISFAGAYGILKDVLSDIERMVTDIDIAIGHAQKGVMK